jgi:hypothetical protein
MGLHRAAGQRLTAQRGSHRVTVTGKHFGGADVYGLLSADGSITWSGNVSDSTEQTVGQ